MTTQTAEKLQIRSGQRVYVANAPDNFTLDLPAEASKSADASQADVVLVFVQNRAELAGADAFLAAARRDAVAYLAYPKARQLGTDLNRNVLWEVLASEGVRPVRQVSLDAVWSALRFRPS